MPIDIFSYTYHQLFCSIPTQVVPKEGFNEQPFFAPKVYPYMPKWTKYNPYWSQIFQNFPVGPKDIFYLSEYIPESKDGKKNDYVDARSRNLVLAFKQGKRDVLHYVAQKLVLELSPECVLVAVPPSDAKKNGDTAVHHLIRRIVNSQTGQDKRLVDGSSCLYRTASVEPSHKGGKRSVDKHLETIGVRNSYLLKNRNVLVLDDILTSGASMTACQIRLKEYVQEIAGFVVGKTIDIDNMRFGFILDLDGTLFDTESGPIKAARVQAMKTRNWEDAIAFAKGMKPVPGAKELLAKIQASHCDYRLVTSSPKKYAKWLAANLGVDEDHLITYENTRYHKPSTDPYMLAKAQMGIYEPFLIAIGDKMSSDIVPAQKLSMSGVLVGSHSLEVPSYMDMIDLVDHFDEILENVMHSWNRFSNRYTRKHVTEENASERVYWESELEKAKEKHSTVSAISRETYLIAFSTLFGLKLSDVKIYEEDIAAQTNEITAYELYMSYLPTGKSPVSITRFLEKLYALQEFIEEQQELGVGLLTHVDKNFPVSLKKEKDAPVYLFYEGNVKALDKKAITVITPNTKEFFPVGTTKNFSKLASETGCVIVSGFRDGCDQAAIEGAGECIGVLEKPFTQKKDDYKGPPKKILDHGGCIVSIALPETVISKEIRKKEAMHLKLMLGKGIFAFGYQESERTERLLPRGDYFALLETCGKPVGYYQCTLRQLKKFPGMSINDDLDVLYGFTPLSSGESLKAFLAQCSK